MKHWGFSSLTVLACDAKLTTELQKTILLTLLILLTHNTILNDKYTGLMTCVVCKHGQRVR